MKARSRGNGMGKTVRFVIPGKPQGKARARYNRKQQRIYTPHQTALYEEIIASEYLAQVGAGVALRGPIGVIIVANFKIPKGAGKNRRAEMLEGKIRPEIKPDVDNIEKAVLDSLNGIAYDDDKSVVDCHTRKFYHEENNLIVILSEIG